jgi:hypothetical protein
VTGLKTAAPWGRLRGVRATALLAGAIAVVVALLSGCGAGKVTQTADIVAPLTGVDGESADGTLAVRDVMIAYSGPGGYRAGEPVPLLVRVFNNRVDGPPVRLVGVTAREMIDGVEQDGGNVVLVGTPAPASPGGSAAESAAGSPSDRSASAGPTPSGNGKRSSATASAVPSATPAPISPPAGGSAAFAVAVPTGGYVLLLPGSGGYLEITGRSRELTARQSLTLTFQFDNGLTVEVKGVHIGVPASPASRAPGEVEESER